MSASCFYQRRQPSGQVMVKGVVVVKEFFKLEHINGALTMSSYHSSGSSIGRSRTTFSKMTFLHHYHNFVFHRMIIALGTSSWTIGVASRQTRTRQGIFSGSHWLASRTSSSRWKKTWLWIVSSAKKQLFQPFSNYHVLLFFWQNTTFREKREVICLSLISIPRLED